jgi:hypothetical protein
MSNMRYSQNQLDRSGLEPILRSKILREEEPRLSSAQFYAECHIDSAHMVEYPPYVNARED